MPWKTDENGSLTLDNGNPVWVGDGGTENAVDYQSLSTKLTETTRESVKRKETIRGLEERLSVLDGIDDPEKFFAEARKAMQTVKSYGEKDLVEAGKVEEVKAEVAKAMQAKIDEAVKRAETAEQTLNRELIGGSFARSKYIAEKMAIPVDMAEAYFGRHFAIDGGQVIGKGHDGQTIYSRENPGEVAKFDEALSILVDGYQNKGSILKGSTASGGGAQNGGGKGGSNGAKEISRAEFDAKNPAEKMAFVKGGGKVQD